MENQRKVYVFSKNEIVLIFLFIVLIAITSFVFGIKIGKSYSYQQANLTTSDRMTVELKSEQEEKVDQVIEDSSKGDTVKGKVLDETYKKLEAEFNTLEEGRAAQDSAENMDQVTPQDTPTQMEMETMNEPEPVAKEEPKEAPAAKTDESLTGKYTLQLASYRSLEDAEKFADGFKVRGYGPMVINKVEIKNRGTWFRVSLGAFASLKETKDFINKEQSLLKGSSYVIRKFDN